jgi:hypothetical protein
LLKAELRYYRPEKSRVKPGEGWKERTAKLPHPRKRIARDLPWLTSFANLSSKPAAASAGVGKNGKGTFGIQMVSFEVWN